MLAGTAVTLSATATGYPAPTVQWERSDDDGASWQAVAGAASTSLAIPTLEADDGARYRAVFTNSVATTTTDTAVIRVGTAPQITSADAALFPGGVPTEFSVRTTGYPAPAISAGTLPGWLTFTDNGDGTATLAGTAPVGGSSHPVTVTAANGFGSPASQVLTVTAADAPAFTNPGSATFSVGVTGGFGILTAPGVSPVTSLALTGGLLPSGLSFTDGGMVAAINGTPAPGSGGEWVVEVTATNAAGLTSAQTITIVVQDVPVITSGSNATFVRGVEGSVTVSTRPGFPMATTLTVVGTLPAGLDFVDNGDGTATVSGLTVVEPTSVTVAVTPTNGVGSGATQSLAVDVIAAPAVPLPVLPPIGHGAPFGVPAQVTPGQPFTISGSGFAAFGLITLGMYSTPTTLGTAIADATGSFTATVTVPVGVTGQHRLVATGISPNGTERFLVTEFSIAVPPVPAAPTTAAATAAGSALPATGVSGDAVGFGLLGAALLLLMGLGLIVRRPRRGRAI